MKFLGNILSLLFIMSASFIYAQTPGFNYQALILNNEEIQIPGTDVKENNVPLGLAEVTFRFSITNENSTEYIEEQTIVTDEYGMVSLIVGEGTPVRSSFRDIDWDGKLKYLIVELDILNDNEGFVLLDRQRILYIPHPSNGSSAVFIVETLAALTPPYGLGDLAWVKNYRNNGIPTLMIFNGADWIPATNDSDTSDEFGLIVVADELERNTLFNPVMIGDQVWNQACNCIEVFNGTTWVSTNTITTTVSNGISLDGETIKLGGDLNEPTFINTSATNTLAITGLEESTSVNDDVVVLEEGTGVLKKKSLSSLLDRTEVILTAVDGQRLFPTPLPITSVAKLDVYRNGSRISFIMINATTIELEAEAICYKGDKIRIVQLR